VGIKANGGRMDQFEDGIGVISNAREVEGGRGSAKSCVGFKTERHADVGMGKLGSILRVCVLVVAVLIGIMIGSSAVNNENSFVGSLNLMLSLFDLMGALILLKLDRQTEK
jgi:hypothetical protein